ncbi:MAG: hypothetical protein F8N37_22665 [Telmatospirillum sp.]|nr:hypothetical protein [Telmatospirillum sp.]
MEGDAKSTKCLYCGCEETIEAHIIPKAFGRLVRGNAQNTVRVTSGRTKKDQFGVYDNGILGAKCDGKLGEYDEYAHSFCRSFATNHKITDQGFFQVDGADCAKFSKFILAVLWRASVSKRPECQGIELGPYAPKIAEIIFGRRPLSDLPEFDLLLIRLQSSRLVPENFYTMPNRGKILECNSYGFLLTGFRIAAKLDRRELPVKIQPFSINKSNIMQGAVGDFDSSPEVMGIKKIMASNALCRPQKGAIPGH